MENIIIRDYVVLGTDVRVVQAWEPMNGHRQITTINGEWYGRIGTSPLPIEIQNMRSFSPERNAAVCAWHEAERQRAYDAIEAHNPELVGQGRREYGEIEINI